MSTATANDILSFVTTYKGKGSPECIYNVWNRRTAHPCENIEDAQMAIDMISRLQKVSIAQDPLDLCIDIAKRV